MSTALALPLEPVSVAFPEVVASRDVDRRVFAARVARVAFGVPLAVGAAALAVDAIARFPVSAQSVLAGAWLVAVAAVPLGWLVARGAAGLDVVSVGRVGDRLLVPSLAWPLVGLALLLPLGIHSVVDIVGIHESTKDFNQWVAMSCVLVGHCHIALAIMGARRASRLARGEKAMPPVAIWGVVIGLAMVPGAILLLVPPVVVAATGLPFLFLLWLPDRIIQRERAALSTSA